MGVTPIVEVHADNICQIWPTLRKDMFDCSFMAMDAEMSGLGSEINTFQSNADDRYKTMKNAAQTRSLVSIGITCFRLSREETKDKSSPSSEDEEKAEFTPSICYEAKSYNILLLCANSFTIDPNAVSFLVKHGFDFNMQFAKGLKYKKGDYVKPKESGPCHKNESNVIVSARELFEEIIRVRKPLIFHNGFADVVFLYECFYASLPNKLSIFLSDLKEMFPSGIYDTKVIAHFHDNLKSTFLEYVTKSYQALNAKHVERNRPHIKLVFTDSISTVDDLIGPPIVRQLEPKLDLKICVKFAKRGWCGLYNAGKCNLSHSVADILAQEEKEKQKKRKRKKHQSSDDSEAVNVSNEKKRKIENAPTLPDCNGANKVPMCHRAGLDSLLTGFAFAVFTASRTKKGALADAVYCEAGNFTSEIPYFSETLKNELMNRLYLNGKNPLWVTKSHFSKTSGAHDNNIIRIFME